MPSAAFAAGNDAIVAGDFNLCDSVIRRQELFGLADAFKKGGWGLVGHTSMLARQFASITC